MPESKATRVQIMNFRLGHGEKRGSLNRQIRSEIDPGNAMRCTLLYITTSRKPDFVARAGARAEQKLCPLPGRQQRPMMFLARRHHNRIARTNLSLSTARNNPTKSETPKPHRAISSFRLALNRDSMLASGCASNIIRRDFVLVRIVSRPKLRARPCPDGRATHVRIADDW